MSEEDIFADDEDEKKDKKDDSLDIEPEDDFQDEPEDEFDDLPMDIDSIEEQPKEIIVDIQPTKELKPKPKENPDLEEIKTLLSEYIKKKKDNKFKLNTDFVDLIELAQEFSTRTYPIFQYMIIRLDIKENYILKAKIEDKLNEIKNLQKVVEYYNKYNSSFGNSLIKYKLIHYVSLDEPVIRHLVISLYALMKDKEKPVRQQTVGFGEQEFDEISGG